VLRNKPPYDSQAKFKAEQDDHYDDWLAQIKKLGAHAEEYIAGSAGAGEEAAAPAKGAKKDDLPPELVAAISADLEKCGGIAEKFMGFLQKGDAAGATGLMSDTAFQDRSRDDFVAALKKSNQKLGALKTFTPDTKPDFGMKNGAMTFTLQADSEYENAKVRETLVFIRNKKGEIEFVGYDRKAKE
jgi:hypothetical protein